MKKIHIVIFASASFLLFSFKIFAIEGFSQLEIAVREKHKSINLALRKCQSPYVDRLKPTSMEQITELLKDESICPNERKKARDYRLYFNKFMRELQSKPPHKVSRKKYREFELKYRKFTEFELDKIHKEHCIYKNRSSGSSECNAIASERYRKTYIRKGVEVTN